MDVPKATLQSSTVVTRGPVGGALRRVAVARGKVFSKVLRGVGKEPAGRACAERERETAHGPPATGHRAMREDTPARSAREVGEGDGGEEAPRRPHEEISMLDPGVRHAASLAPPLVPLATAAPAATDAPLRARSLEELLPALVKRIAWAGDRHSGSVRLELGAGAYAGTTVVVHADAGRVRVEISGSEGPELDRLRTRLDRRLRGHGLDVESVA